MLPPDYDMAAGLRPIASVRLEHAGDFRIGIDATSWRPFSSTQQYSTMPPGFVWDAAIKYGPFLSVRVRDSYLGGSGTMQATLAGVIPLVNAHDRPGLDAGALQRYLAEAVWFPTALLPRPGLHWTALDANTARATLRDGATVVSLDFTFDNRGAIVAAYTPLRSRDVQGHDVPTPWRCHYAAYKPASGFLIPFEGAVEWLLESGPLTYWRGRITALDYTLA